MFIQEVIVDGFKSYSQRTVIAGWDATFNAITGLNGSGKSNILDAICFVLGISNLSQVRAASLQDLVYKQGQAGITKATVTVVFNNQDASQSPIGYEHHETISVCRQVRFSMVEMFNYYFSNSNRFQLFFIYLHPLFSI
jgi:structural maintenance of chromosome 2